jgi:hypothetical protein
VIPAARDSANKLHMALNAERNVGDARTTLGRVEDEMDRPPRTDSSAVPHQHDVVSKERLDEWLDDALADTFPASDPVASPPWSATPHEDDRSASSQSGAEPPIAQRSHR